MKLKVEIEWPDDVPMSRFDLADKLAEVMYTPSGSMTKPLKVGKKEKSYWVHDNTKYKWKIV